VDWFLFCTQFVFMAMLELQAATGARIREGGLFLTQTRPIYIYLYLNLRPENLIPVHL